MDRVEVRVMEKEELMTLRRQMKSHSCKETCNFIVNNFFRRKESNSTNNNNNIIDDDDNDDDCSFVDFKGENDEFLSKTTTTTIIKRQMVDLEKSHITRSLTFSSVSPLPLPLLPSVSSAPPGPAQRESVAIFTPTSTSTTTVLAGSATTPFVGAIVSQTPLISPILSTSSEVFDLLTTPSTKTELIFQGELLLCRLGAERTVLKRLVSSTCLRRWERHRLVLDNCDIHSSTPSGFMETSISYKDIREIILLPRLQQTNRFCIHLALENQQSVILQTNSMMQRSQWFYSIQWRAAMVKFDSIMRSLSDKTEIPVQHFKDLMSVALKSAIKDSSIQHYPLHALSFLLSQHQSGAGDNASTVSTFKKISQHLSLVLDTSTLTKEMCDFYNKHKSIPCYRGVILILFKPVVLHVLKHDVKFIKNSRQFAFVQDYIVTVGKEEQIRDFLQSVHGDVINCPHRNVLPNLVSLCLSSIHNGFQIKKRFSSASCGLLSGKQDERLKTFFTFLEIMSEFDDWRLNLARLLHSVPFSEESLEDHEFFKRLQPILTSISKDERCEVHTTLMRVSNRNSGWLDLLCPGGNTCFDGGLLFKDVMERLFNCCCRRKSFIQSHLNLYKSWTELAIKGNKCAIELLVLTLEYNMLTADHEILDTKSALSATIAGRNALDELNRRQNELKELQQKEGPQSLTLPARATDEDLSRTLSSGPIGNLESLNLAFTMVTSSCATDLIKLPSLKYLNLWSTKFGDEGLRIISEHMPLLQALNLCETPVTDKGLRYLTSLKNLQKLNLNSTNLSAMTFEALKEKLPSLQECDVCYTDAW